MTVPTTDTAARPKLPRIGLLDTLRGAALIAMATYHFGWDIELVGYLPPGTATTGWMKLYARSIASTFVFIVGVSLVLANTPETRWKSFWKRLGMIVAAAAAISVATYFLTPGEWIFFGILHSIAVLSVIGMLLLRLPLPVIIVLTVVATAAWIADTFVSPGILRWPFFNPRYLAWIGFAEMPQRSNDYVPLFPWIVPFLLGFTSAALAIRTELPAKLAAMGTGSSLLAKIGRRSLSFYLIHQPVLISIAFAMAYVVPPAKPDPAETYLQQCNTSCTVEQGQALCRSFCQCTLDKLQEQQLFTPFQSGEIKPDDGRILSLASECSAAPQ